MKANKDKKLLNSNLMHLSLEERRASVAEAIKRAAKAVARKWNVHQQREQFKARWGISLEGLEFWPMPGTEPFLKLSEIEKKKALKYFEAQNRRIAKLLKPA